MKFSALLTDRENRPAIAIVSALMILGFVLRIANLDAVSLWVDEYVHVLRAKGVVDGTGELFGNDNGGILLTMFIIPLFQFIDSNAFTARLPSVLFGTACIPLIYIAGKRLFNKPVGYIAASLSTLSLYLIFWSRAARNYSIFEFFYLLVLLCFLAAFESYREKLKQPEIFNKLRLNAKYLAVLPVLLILSILSHNLSFFFLFSAGLYFLLTALIRRIKPDFGRSSTLVYNVAGIAFVIVAAMLFIPGLSDIMKAPLSLFLPPDYVDWFVPDWASLGEAWKEKPYESFDRYFGMIKYDFNYLYIFGVLGLITAFIQRFKAGIFLLSFLVFPFILMSFIFREPYLPRYLIYIYPLFLISVAGFIHFIADRLLKFFFKKTSATVRTAIVAALTLTAVLPALRYTEVLSLVKAEKKSGFIVDKSLTHWSFTNWVDPLKTVKEMIGEDDFILSTVPGASRFYLDRNDVEWFRQRHYDAKEGGYVPNEYEEGKYNGRTLRNLKETFENHDRVWLTADYYLFGPLTDPSARQYVFQNMRYHLDASSEGDVYVFSYDRNSQTQPMAAVIHVGPQHRVSQSLTLNLPGIKNYPAVNMFFDVEGIDFNEEAVVIFNNSYSQFLPAPGQKGRTQTGIQVNTQYLKNGENSIKFQYYPEKPDRRDQVPGFAVYNAKVGS